MRVHGIVGLVLWFLTLPGYAFASDTIQIAYIANLSGPFALQGDEDYKAFLAAVDLVNSRGGVLHGKRFEIVPIDNKGTPQESLIALKRVIDLHIRYVTATVSSVAHAISDALVKHNARDPDRSVLFLDYQALDPALTESKCSFWHFRFDPHADTQLNVLTDYLAAKQTVRRVYLINQDYSFGQAVSKGARSTLTRKRPDIEIVGDDLVPLGKVKDFAPYVSKIKASGADSVLTGNWGNDLSLLVKASQEGGLQAGYYTLLGAVDGTPTAIGAAGDGRVVSVWAWHINAADAALAKAMLEYKTKYKAMSNMDFLPAFRVIEMLTSAIDKAGSDDPFKVAYALEGMTYQGPSGDSWMRADDHQLIAPIYVLSWTKSGQPNVKYDSENTGYGWRTETIVAAKDAVPPIFCKMERPSQ